MDTLETKCASLRAQIAATEAQLAGLKRELDLAERAATATITASETKTESKTCNGTASHSGSGVDTDADTDTATGTAEDRTWPMLDEEYRRYGRQMIVEQIGLEGQLKLRSTRVLIVGAGGLGCPAAMYLAAAGVGTLGMVDGDTVEVSNLHRQVLHRARNVGRFKVDSAIEYLRELNPHPTYIPHREHLSPQEAAKIFANYDLILDCTDNPATRYLISDTAVLLGKPLVSASALRTEGQLMVLNNPPRPAGDQTGGPCYRCVFPKPPPATSVVTCADGGIIGPVVGTMGVIQALEAIKVITGDAPSPPALQIFSAFSSPLFRTIKLRSRRANCAVCSAEASVTLDTVASGSTDYIFFCGITDPGILLSPEERISALEYQKTAPTSTKHTLIDVREKVQFDICSLDNSVNVPISTILSASRNHNNNNNNNNDPNPSGQRPLPPWLPADIVSAESTDPIYVVCRLGNDSQLAVQKLKELGLDRGGERFVGDIQGGLRAWRRDVDHEWPEY